MDANNYTTARSYNAISCTINNRAASPIVHRTLVSVMCRDDNGYIAFI